MPKRRGHGEGSIYLDNRGRWIAEIDLGRDANGKRRRRSRTARTRREARQKLRELQDDVAAQLDLGGADVTVNHLLDRVIDHARSRGRQPKTIDNYEWAASHIRSAFGPKKARDITALEIEAHLEHLAVERKLSRSSLGRILRTFRQALDEGIRHDWLGRNVATVARCPDSHATTRRALTIEQARSLIDATTGTRLHAAVVILISCGLRPGELLGLMWSDVDLDAAPPTITVARALKHDRTGTYLGDLKTETSHRTIALTTKAVVALRSHGARQGEGRLALGPLWHDHDLVFANEIGRPWDPRNFRRDFKRAAASVGLDWVVPYEMRHTAVTLLSDADVPSEQIADLAGHRDTRMVQRVYRHRTAQVVASNKPMEQLLG